MTESMGGPTINASVGVPSGVAPRAGVGMEAGTVYSHLSNTIKASEAIEKGRTQSLLSKEPHTLATGMRESASVSAQIGENGGVAVSQAEKEMRGLRALDPDYKEEEINQVPDHEKLTKMAKELGTDETYDKLANDESIFEDKVKDSEDEDTPLEEGKPTDLKEVKEEQDPMLLRAEEIKSKIDNLIEQNKLLKEGMLKNAEVSLQAIVLSRQALALLEELLKDKKEEENVSVVELLVKAMIALLNQFVPQEGDGILDGQSKEERKQEQAYENMAKAA
ncbi:MAG TPA: hypothetical protein VG917_00490 [Patescibacteria group bacterium]|nr:hypothetical protein [Patescibacteria group bacterium]